MYLALRSGHTTSALIIAQADPRALVPSKRQHRMSFRSLAIQKAINANHEKLVELLVARGHSLSRGIPNPLLTAISRFDNNEMLRLLIKLGADVNQVNIRTHFSALHECAAKVCTCLMCLSVSHLHREINRL